MPTSFQCIDQTNSDEKHDQISNMGLIYSGAALVIIAAAGSDPTYGLPGVSTRARREQRFLSIGNHTLVETYPDLSSELAASIWTRRAWTYQEGHLARRRLVFTDKQVSYVCDYGYCVETLRSLIRIANCLPKYSMGETFATSCEQYEPWYYHRCLAEYTKRVLSYDSDSLNAYLGVLGSWAPTTLSRASGAFIHLWGLKITKDWLALDWYHERPGKRRSGFPTWSWASTKGVVEYLGLARDHGAEHMEVVLKPTDNKAPSFSGEGNSTVKIHQPLREYFSGLKGLSPDLRSAPRQLRITGICLSLQSTRIKEGRARIIQFPLHQGYLDCNLYLDHVITEANVLDCIALLVHGMYYIRAYQIRTVTDIL